MPTPPSQIMQAYPSFPPLPFPALYLYPLNDSFIPKHIDLTGGQRVKIGRQTNLKTTPSNRNGYFDSKVLSRQHAEVWEESGKIFIKDVKSSNGTFINGDRLSAEGVESDPYELKTDDIVEFGIDIVGEDNKTIIHHKVAARVTCIFNVEDCHAGQREAYDFHQRLDKQREQFRDQRGGQADAVGAGANKRPMLQPQSSGVGIMGGMGGGARQPGRNGLTFDHILQRLSGELQKSRETGAELGIVAGAMGEIENVMGGGQPPNLPPYPHVLPPVRAPSQQSQQQQQQQQSDAAPPSAALQALHNQLSETQASLTSHIVKVRTLEDRLSDHENIKRDVDALRNLIEEQRQREHIVAQRMRQLNDEDEDEDDRRSVHTIVPHELESVPEEDETEAEETEEERRARREELGRPRTPEPSSLGMHDDDDDQRRSGPAHPPGIPDEMTRRLAFLSDQLETSLELTRSLQEQHTVAQQTIETLSSKVNNLEELVRSTQASQVTQGSKLEEEAASREQTQQATMGSMFAEFRKTIEDRWESVKHDWESERERMDTARNDWETRVKGLEEGVAIASTKFESGLTGLANQLAGIKQNGFIPLANKHTGGLVTPPSPRSLSDADSDSDRPLKEKVTKNRKRSRSHRGRSTKAASRSRSPATSTSATLVDGMSSAAGTESSVASLHSRRSSADSQKVERRGDVLGEPEATPLALDIAKFRTGSGQFPPTPESSVHIEDAAHSARKGLHQQSTNNVQFAVGVFVLGFATAAVLWRVKE